MVFVTHSRLSLNFLSLIGALEEKIDSKNRKKHHATKSVAIRMDVYFKEQEKYYKTHSELFFVNSSDY